MPWRERPRETCDQIYLLWHLTERHEKSAFDCISYRIDAYHEVDFVLHKPRRSWDSQQLWHIIRRTLDASQIADTGRLESNNARNSIFGLCWSMTYFSSYFNYIPLYTLLTFYYVFDYVNSWMEKLTYAPPLCNIYMFHFILHILLIYTFNSRCFTFFKFHA